MSVKKKIRKKRIFLIVKIVVAFLLVFFLCIKLCVHFTLNGNNEVYLEVGREYKEKGTTFKIFNNVMEKDVKVKNNVNSKKIGKYYVDYSTKYLFVKFHLRRTVNVVDSVKPLIKINGRKEMYLYLGEKYEEPGAVAYDNYDKDISDKIKITGKVDINKEGKYEIKYTVTDSSDNKKTVKRIVNVIENNKLDDINAAISAIEDYIYENDLYVSIGYYNLKTGDTYYYNEDELYYSASLIKILDAMYLYDNNMIDDDLKEYVKDAISISDNDAHFYLFNYIGYDELKEYAEKLGAEHALEYYDEFGETNVLDQIAYYKNLYKLIKNGNNEELKSFFINDYYNELDFDDVHFAHKYGYYDGYYHDAGIYLGNDPYIVVILTYEGDYDYGDVEEVNELSRLIYQYHISH